MSSHGPAGGSAGPEELGRLGLTREALLNMLSKMLEIRKFEEKVEELFLVKGLLTGPSHLYYGQEAVAVGVLSALRQDDKVVTTYRCHGHALARGVSVEALMAELFGRATGTCKGLGGSMHAAISLEHGIPVATAIVGSGLPIAAGLALALRYRKSDALVACFFGDGAVNTGAFHEALNICSLWRLPVLFVCENNYYAEFTPLRASLAAGSITSRAASYGMATARVFGNDVIEVYRAAAEAARRIRAGEGPYFLECETYRRGGHGVYDKATYRPKEEVERWLSKDPIELFKSRLSSWGLLDADWLSEVEGDIERRLERAVQEAQSAPLVPFEQLGDFVYA
ncbi:MAG: pyruvate dehydrogenase (acetyl-transferring) E1 component subunit alpha [Nitrososphaerota archaeon]